MKSPLFFALSVFLPCSSMQPVINPSFEILTKQGFPQGWQAVGERVTVTEDAYSGNHAIRLRRIPSKDPETGLNLDWEPHSGRQDNMLSQLQGGLVFRYKAISGQGKNLSVQVIPMSAGPFEDTGEPRSTFTVPQEHVGDGQWHEGRLKYDFTACPQVQWIQVSPRLVGGAGELLLDDIFYVERVGPSLSVTSKVKEDPSRPGSACQIECVISNLGDEPSEQGECLIIPPPGLASSDFLSRIIPSIDPDETYSVHWSLEGKRTGQSLAQISIRSGNVVKSTPLLLEPRLKLLSLLSRPFMVQPGEAFLLEARVLNHGTASLAPVRARVETPPGWILNDPHIPKEILPSQQAIISWSVTCSEEEDACLHFILEQETGEPLTAQSLVRSTRTLATQSKPLGRYLWIRDDNHRSLGEIRLGHGHHAHTVATCPHLGCVTYLSPNGEQVTLYAGPSSRWSQGRFRSSVEDPHGGQWEFEIIARESEVSWADLITFKVRCDQARDLLAFEGPLVYAGEGMRDFVRADGLFPGLEWLTRGELSSDDTDIAIDHEDRIRYVPHPNKVTIPLMSVRSDRDLCVALLWDAHHPWDGTKDRLQPIFASPDRFSGRAGHLMGLMVPHVDAGLRENERLATDPYFLKEGATLEISCAVMVLPRSKDALVAMDTWFQLFQPDPVLAPPRGSYADQVAFSMKAYTKSLLLSHEEGWLPFLGGPSIWRKPSHNPQFAFDLLQCSRFAGTVPERNAWSNLAMDQMRRGNQRPSAEDLGFGSGYMVQTLQALAHHAYQTIDRMEQDGSWRFDANYQDQGVFKGMDYHELGQHGALELGLLARNVYEILRYCRLSGDWNAYEACKKTLDLMTTFEIPRAAQVWEVPVHSPDILAAADAIDAFLEAYRLTRETRWLAEAQRWARAGLPFVYVWNEEGKPWMRFGSIPVFGATWMQHSWFGVLVQWNGLRYAYALLKLSEYDPGPKCGPLTWEDMARGLTHSAMYQQSMEEDKMALWPDAIHTVTCVRADWDFAPRQILKNVYTLVGREEEPQSVIWREKNGNVHLSTCAKILAARKSSDQVKASLQYPEGNHGSTVLAGITKPIKVEIDGKESLEVHDDLEAIQSDHPCWLYDSTLAAAIIHYPGDNKWRLSVQGIQTIKPSLIPHAVIAPDFHFLEGTEGWVALHDISRLRASDGVLHVSMSGGDPYLARTRCHWKGEDYPRLYIKLRVPCGVTGQLYWQTHSSPQFDEEKAHCFPIRGHDRWYEYELNLGDHPLWSGQIITTLRFDPTDGCQDREAQIGYISFLPGGKTP